MEGGNMEALITGVTRATADALIESSSDTLSDISEWDPDPVASLPVYPRSSMKSSMNRAGITTWLQTAGDNKNNPVEVGSDSPEDNNSSPAAPAERSFLRKLPVKRSVPPPWKTSLQKRARLQKENSTLRNNDSTIIKPKENSWESIKTPASNLPPSLSPPPRRELSDLLPVSCRDHVEFGDFIHIGKLLEDGHWAGAIVEVIEVRPEDSQQSEGELMEEFESDDCYFADQSSPVKAGEVGDCYFTNQSFPNSNYLPPYQVPDEYLQLVDYHAGQPTFNQLVSGTHQRLSHDKLRQYPRISRKADEKSRCSNPIRAPLPKTREGAKVVAGNYKSGHRTALELEEAFPEFNTATNQEVRPHIFHGPGDIMLVVPKAYWDEVSEWFHGLYQGTLTNAECYDGLVNKGYMNIAKKPQLLKEYVGPDLNPWKEYTGLPRFERFVNNQQIINNHSRAESDGGGSREIDSSLAAAFQYSPLVGESREQPIEHRNYTFGAQDMINNLPASFQRRPLMREARQQPIRYQDYTYGNQDLASNPPASFQRRPLVGEAIEKPGEHRKNTSGDLKMRSSLPTAFQYSPLADEARELPGRHEISTKDFVTAGQAFVERRIAILQNGSQLDSAVEVHQVESVLSHEVKEWLAYKLDKWFRSHPNPAARKEFRLFREQTLSNLRRNPPSRPSVQKRVTPEYAPPAFALAPDQEQIERRLVSPVKDPRASCELANDEVNALVDASQFKLDSAPTRIDSSNKFVPKGSTHPKVDMDVDMIMAAEDSSFADRLLTCPEDVALPELEVQVVSNGGNAFEDLPNSRSSLPSEDTDMEIALDVNSSPSHQHLPSRKKTPALEVEGQIVSTPDKTPPLEDNARSSSTLGPESETHMYWYGAPAKDVEGPIQDTVIAESDHSMQPTDTTRPNSVPPLNVGTGSSSVPTCTISLETTRDYSSDGDAPMDLDSDDEVSQIETSPVRLAPVAIAAPPPAPAVAPGPVPVLNPTLKPDRGRGLKSTYSKERYTEKRTTNQVFKRVNQQNPPPKKDVHSLTGPTESSSLLFSPGRSQFQSQVSQSPSGASGHYGMNAGFPQPLSQFPQYPSSPFGPGELLHGHNTMRPVNVPGYFHQQAGGSPQFGGGKTSGRGNDSRGGLAPYHIGRPSRGEPKRPYPHFSPPEGYLQNSFDSRSRSTNQNNTPTPVPRLPPSTQNVASPRRHKGTESRQPSRTHLQQPARTLPTRSSIYVPESHSLQLPAKPPPECRVSPGKMGSPQKPAGEWILFAFRLVEPAGYQAAWVDLQAAKQKDGRKDFEISETYDNRHGKLIKVTGPKGSAVRQWATPVLASTGTVVGSYP